MSRNVTVFDHVGETIECEDTSLKFGWLGKSAAVAAEPSPGSWDEGTCADRCISYFNLTSSSPRNHHLVSSIQHHHLGEISSHGPSACSASRLTISTSHCYRDAGLHRSEQSQPGALSRLLLGVFVRATASYIPSPSRQDWIRRVPLRVTAQLQALYVDRVSSLLQY